jgi:hypothetical protein
MLATLPALAWLVWKRSWIVAVLIAIVGLGLAPLSWFLVQAGVRPNEWTPTELVGVVVSMTLLAFAIGGLVVLLVRAKSPTSAQE